MPPKRRVLPLCSGLTLLLEFAVHLAALAGPEAGPICVGLSSGGPNPVVPFMAGIPLFSRRFSRVGFRSFFVRRRFFFARMGEKIFLGLFEPPNRFLAQNPGFQRNKRGFAPGFAQPARLFGSQLCMPALSTKRNSRHAVLCSQMRSRRH